MRLEEELRHVLREGVSGVGESEEAWNAIERRLEPQASGHFGRRFAAAAAALSVSAASLIGLWLAFRSAPTDRLGGEPIDLDPRVTAVVPVGPFPGDLAVGEGAVWVGVPAQPPNQDRQLIVRIDAATNEVVARIPMDDYIEELAAGEGGVWGNAVAGTAADPVFSIVRIDPVTNEVVATIHDVSGPFAAGEGALWAVGRAGARADPDGSTLLRIDPSTNRVAARIPLGVALWDIEVGEGYVWVLTFEPNPGDGDILQVDPRTNEVVARIDIPVPGSVYAPALGEGSAWVPVCCIDNRQVLVRVDAKTHRIVGEPIRVEAAAPFAAAAGHVWLFGERGTLYGLDVETLEMDVRVPESGGPSGVYPDPAAELDPDHLAVWIPNYRDSVTRIDLAASPVVDPLVIEITPPEVRDGTFVAPRFGASYRGTPIPLEAIETPGSELEYPSTLAPVPLSAGTPIEVHAEGAESVAVFELQRAPGEYVREGSCIVPGSIASLPNQAGRFAFFIYADWGDSVGGMAFAADLLVEAPHDGEEPYSTPDVDARLLGLAVCEA